MTRTHWVLAAASTLLLAGCANQPSKGVALETSIEKLIPGDTVVLAGAHIKEIQSSPLYVRLMGDKKLPELESFVKQTGLDPRKDVTELIVASNGKDTLMIARGHIESIPTLEGLLEKQGATSSMFEGHKLLGSDNGSVSFLSNSVAIAGTTARVKEVLAGKTGDDSKKRQVLAKVAKIEHDKHVWVVAIGGFSPMPLPEQGNLANLARIFQSLDTTLVTLDLSHGLSLMAQGFCTDGEGAKQLHNTLRGLIGFGRLSTPGDNPEMLRFFDSIKVEQTDRQVRVNADVPMDMVDRFLKLTEKKKPSAGA